MPMTSAARDQALEIAALRCRSEIVLRATSSSWTEIHRLIAQLCSSKDEELSFPLLDVGANGKSSFSAVANLVVRLSNGALNHSLIGSTLVIEGDCENLLSLAENIDPPNPFEGAHHHSDSWVPGVSPASISLVFSHVARPSERSGT